MNEPTISVKIKMLDPDLPVPSYAHPSDAGADLHARESAVLQPGERALIRTGLAIALPHGYVGLVHPRSGLLPNMELQWSMHRVP